MALADLALRRSKPKDKPYRMSDGHGLYVVVQTNGSKWWRFDYTVNGKRKTISLGVPVEPGRGSPTGGEECQSVPPQTLR